MVAGLNVPKSPPVSAEGPLQTPLFCRSEEHTSELQSRPHLVCRLLLEKKKKKIKNHYQYKTKNCSSWHSIEYKSINHHMIVYIFSCDVRTFVYIREYNTTCSIPSIRLH